VKRGVFAGRSVACALALAAALLSALFADSARAQSIPLRRAGIHWTRESTPTLDVSIRDVASSETAKRKLMSGLPQLLTLRVVGYTSASQPKSLSATVRSCRVVYDLWEEVFRVQLGTAQSDAAFRAKTVEEVLDRCLVLRKAVVGTAEDYRRHRGRDIYFAVLAELNPLSAQTVQRIRGWLARPAGDRMEGEAFFGSFVSLFVNHRIGQAERIVRFRSQSVRVP
jgi:hypothetical protein